MTDDLFTVSGRANWMLRNLSRKNFGYVRPTTSASDLAKLQQSWLRWLSGEQVEDVQEIYVSSEKVFEKFEVKRRSKL